MATAVILLSTGTVSAPLHLPTEADGTDFNSNIAATTGTTAALTGDLDANQSVLLSANSFESLNQFVGIMAAAWSVSGRAALVRIMKMAQAMLDAPNAQPTAG